MGGLYSARDDVLAPAGLGEVGAARRELSLRHRLGFRSSRASGRLSLQARTALPRLLPGSRQAEVDGDGGSRQPRTTSVAPCSPRLRSGSSSGSPCDARIFAPPRPVPWALPVGSAQVLIYNPDGKKRRVG